MHKRERNPKANLRTFFKLMYNSVFGKIMENIRKHVNVKLVDTVSKFKLLTGKPNFNLSKFVLRN